ncbi:MAG: hypothetical protein GJV46_14650 [Geobacter sp.]|nr:hypothetical protein [Geobacter sp.]
MKQHILFIIALLSAAAPVCADDSIAVGIRAGGAAGRSSYSTEVFGELYLNRLVSIGATLGYTIIDRDNKQSVKRDEAVPITALFKAHAPFPVIKPYAGLGQALIFHNDRGTKGSVVGLAGVDIPIGPFFLNAEYRRQLDDRLDILAGGVGTRF